MNQNWIQERTEKEAKNILNCLGKNTTYLMYSFNSYSDSELKSIHFQFPQQSDTTDTTYVTINYYCLKQEKCRTRLENICPFFVVRAETPRHIKRIVKIFAKSIINNDDVELTRFMMQHFPPIILETLLHNLEASFDSCTDDQLKSALFKFPAYWNTNDLTFVTINYHCLLQEQRRKRLEIISPSFFVRPKTLQDAKYIIKIFAKAIVDKNDDLMEFIIKHFPPIVESSDSLTMKDLVEIPACPNQTDMLTHQITQRTMIDFYEKYYRPCENFSFTAQDFTGDNMQVIFPYILTYLFLCKFQRSYDFRILEMILLSIPEYERLVNIKLPKIDDRVFSFSFYMRGTISKEEYEAKKVTMMCKLETVTSQEQHKLDADYAITLITSGNGLTYSNLISKTLNPLQQQLITKAFELAPLEKPYQENKRIQQELIKQVAEYNKLTEEKNLLLSQLNIN